jgi:hypothetical protein
MQWQVACRNVRKNVHHIYYPQQCVLVSFVTVARAVLAVVFTIQLMIKSRSIRTAHRAFDSLRRLIALDLKSMC